MVLNTLCNTDLFTALLKYVRFLCQLQVYRWHCAAHETLQSGVWVNNFELLRVQGQKVPVQELAVRFNCAMQDLQLLGLIKEAGRRRRESCVQRLVFPMRR